MKISARNQFPGKVVATKVGAVMAEVEVEVAASTVIAAITASSLENLDIQAGDRVTVIIKATEVMIAKD